MVKILVEMPYKEYVKIKRLVDFGMGTTSDQLIMEGTLLPNEVTVDEVIKGVTANRELT